MSFRKLVGLAAIGGLVYAHKKRGGQMTLESFKQSGRDLIEGIRGKADEIRSQAESKLQEVKERTNIEEGEVVGGGNVQGTREDVGYGSSGFGYGENRPGSTGR